MKILVTGGAGFIGEHLCRRLTKDGHTVTCIDRKPPKNKIRYFVLDIIHPLPILPFDRIYNLAGTPSPAKYTKDPIRVSQTNVIGTINVMDLAVSCGARVLQASTGEIYEDSDFTGPRACYRHGKRMAESIICDYRRLYNVDTRIARMFSTYGPGMLPDDGRVIPVFVNKALAGQDITVMGNASRSFLYIDDMIEALIALMESELTKPINICDNGTIGIHDLASKIVRLANSSSKILTIGKREDDNVQTNPTQDLACDLLDWKPTIDINTGLELTINGARDVAKAA